MLFRSTGIDQNQRLVGGAILPGLRLQIHSLSTGTAALPSVELPRQLPPRWSDNTQGSISSGILHTVSAGISGFIKDWKLLYSYSQIIFTGGDGSLLSGYLSVDLTDRFRVDRDLVFHGMSRILVEF